VTEDEAKAVAAVAAMPAAAAMYFSAWLCNSVVIP
jgi:hypothetical protein